MTKTIRIGLIGAGWMGRAHATAYRSQPLIYGSGDVEPVLEMVADLRGDLAQGLAREFGFARATEDWRALVSDPAIDVVDIVTPNNAHAEPAIAAARAGKHIYCEKPMAITAGDARTMRDAAESAGVVTLIGYNYLKNPAQALARALIEAGRIGEIIGFRGAFDQDVMTDPALPITWRHKRAIAGSGALGDMASHTLSLAQSLVGDVAEVCGIAETFVKARPMGGTGTGHRVAAAAGGGKEAVENEDSVQFLLRFANGAIGTIGASRMGTGRRLGLGYEIQGTKGALLFTQERMNELQLYDYTEPDRLRGYKTIYIGPDHPGYAAFHPIPGIGLGYNDLKIIEVHDLLEAIAQGHKAEPDFAFAYKVECVVDAVLLSIEERRWVRVSEIAGS